MKMKIIRPLALALLVGIVACERTSVDYAGKKEAVEGRPAYTRDASYASAPNVAVVREVLPQGDEGIDGKTLYASSCAACHQITGQGVPTAFPPLDNSPYVTGDNTDRLASIMLYGLSGPIHVNGQLFNGAMTPWGPVLKDEELAAIATYIRSSWSNKAGPVAPDIFAKMRQKWGARGPFQISELGEEK